MIALHTRLWLDFFPLTPTSIFFLPHRGVPLLLFYYLIITHNINFKQKRKSTPNHLQPFFLFYEINIAPLRFCISGFVYLLSIFTALVFSDLPSRALSYFVPKIRQTVALFLLDPAPYFIYYPVIMDQTFSLLVVLCFDNFARPQFFSIFIRTYRGMTTSSSRDGVNDWFLWLFNFRPPHRFVFPRYNVNIDLPPPYFTPLLFPFIFQYLVPGVLYHVFGILYSTFRLL